MTRFVSLKVRENCTVIQKVREYRHIAQKEEAKFYAFRCSEVCTKGINRVILQVREMETLLAKSTANKEE